MLCHPDGTQRGSPSIVRRDEQHEPRKPTPCRQHRRHGEVAHDRIRKEGFPRKNDEGFFQAPSGKPHFFVILQLRYEKRYTLNENATVETILAETLLENMRKDREEFAKAVLFAWNSIVENQIV